ncbi:hypothetical protein [uncultured Desulfobulbus sp.]|uniref:hypothetical protein n=1 Tax=uncultured Desulfobulbus sp. TaxID=239745 RepID=UPI0029C78E02|nr:hypothetical protein [uncultured Desulfobulbus sp.]
MKKIYSLDDFKKNKNKISETQFDETTDAIKKLLSEQGTSPLVIEEIENKLNSLKDNFLTLPSKTVLSILNVFLVLSCFPLSCLAIYVIFHADFLINNKIETISYLITIFYILLVSINFAEIKYRALSRIIKW